MYTVCDSIGLKQISVDHLLVGVGNVLYLYCTNITRKTSTINLNFSSKIFGICSLNDSKCKTPASVALVYGGREFALIRIKSEQNEIELIKSFETFDWISSIHVYKQNGDSLKICLLTGHNVVNEIIVNVTGKFEIINRSGCIDKCTLYSSLIHGSTWESTSICGSNAFGELVIWNVKSNTFDCDVATRLKAHNGVIFSIDYNPHLNLLTTTSDDRSVKIWNLTFNVGNKKNLAKCSFDSAKSLYGHIARVFKSKFFEYNDKIFIASSGEDSNLCIWSQNGQLIHKQRMPGFASIWNIEYDEIHKQLIASGSDGNIHQFSIKDVIDGNYFDVENFRDTFNDSSEHLSKVRVMQTQNLLIALTNKNKLYFINILEPTKWIPLCLESNEIPYKSIILEVQDNFIAICGYQHASMYSYQTNSFKRVLHEQISEGIVRSVKFLSKKSFIVSSDDGKCTLLKWTPTKYETHEVVGIFSLPVCKERWITSACRHDNYLLIGDRCGNLHFFIMKENSIDFNQTIKQVHGNLGCTCLDFVNENGNFIVFQSAGHDGHLKTIEIEKNSQKMRIVFKKDIPINWCDKIIQFNDRKIISGFNDNHFVTWTPEDEKLYEYECGGGHRYWDLFIENNIDEENKIDLTAFFIRKKRLEKIRFHLNFEKPPFIIERHKWHNQPCNEVQISKVDVKGINKNFIFSGGDDNILKVHQMFDDGKMNFICEITSHISNIKCIKTVEFSNRILIFSGGGRAQICVAELSLNDLKIREKCTYMLRSNDLERKRSGKAHLIDFDPETRFMSIDVLAKEFNSLLNLYVGCSDGHIRCFSYDDKEKSITFNKSVLYIRCILHVNIIKRIDHNFLITCATDGIISFWSLEDFSAVSKPKFSLKHHDSGINSFKIIRSNENDYWIATGGDDQSIVISNIKIIKELFKVNQQKKFPFEHTSQVNGIEYCTKKNEFYSVGVDQVINRIQLENLTVNHYSNTCVSDTKGIKIINDKYLLCFGCGIQIYLIL